MNRYLLASLLAAAAASTSVAFADDITVESRPFVPSMTRADVQMQWQQYKTGGVNPWSTSYDPLRGFASSRTRAEVTAEYLQSRDEVAALNAEDSGSAYLSAHAHRMAPPPVVAGRTLDAR